MFIKNFGRLEINAGGVNLPELGSLHFDQFFKDLDRGKKTMLHRSSDTSSLLGLDDKDLIK